jgi:hypothetical protein
MAFAWLLALFLGLGLGSSSRAARKQVALVMMDDRDPDLLQWKHARKHRLDNEEQAELVTRMTHFLNLKYACSHGYTLLFYKLRESGCSHPLWGDRHASYCKLAAIGEALAAGYRWVVYLDSDAFVRNGRLFLSSYQSVRRVREAAAYRRELAKRQRGPLVPR